MCISGSTFKLKNLPRLCFMPLFSNLIKCCYSVMTCFHSSLWCWRFTIYKTQLPWIVKCACVCVVSLHRLWEFNLHTTNYRTRNLAVSLPDWCETPEPKLICLTDLQKPRTWLFESLFFYLRRCSLQLTSYPLANRLAATLHRCAVWSSPKRHKHKSQTCNPCIIISWGYLLSYLANEWLVSS